MWQTGFGRSCTRSTVAAASAASLRTACGSLVGDAELDIEAHQRLGERPVHHALRDEILVRDQV